MGNQLSQVVEPHGQVVWLGSPSSNIICSFGLQALITGSCHLLGLSGPTCTFACGRTIHVPSG